MEPSPVARVLCPFFSSSSRGLGRFWDGALLLAFRVSSLPPCPCIPFVRVFLSFWRAYLLFSSRVRVPTQLYGAQRCACRASLARLCETVLSGRAWFFSASRVLPSSIARLSCNAINANPRLLSAQPSSPSSTTSFGRTSPPRTPPKTPTASPPTRPSPSASRV
ncbi:hypothetical protein B0H16DRAFT_413848 [Mycena metata]|uniref:Uncharacterized protein n=1 Tax=Mycena metata TaxID=1033252 RepID=A0AAD7JL64_9AGAR|nr:hypothetical protein B0H16DRAFT_413848 [Mycena metata]